MAAGSDETTGDTTATTATTARDRIVLALIGMLAGLAAWGLIEVLPERIDNERTLLFVIAATGGFFAALLAATGPLTLPRAALAAALAAFPAAALLTWASGRFATLDGFLETLHPPVAFAVILMISLPFLIATLLPVGRWQLYPVLFTEAWNIVVRTAAAWLFVAVFWAVLFLSDTLFGLVGLTVIEDVIDIEPVPYLLTGAVLGLALAVVVELSDYVSPFLILRLLRLLVPVVQVVIGVFLIALPFRGLSELFGGLSAAATLMAMAIGVVTLISSALDRSDEEAANGAVMRVSVQLLALGLPLLAGLAVYAVWLRVAGYGWSPNRLAAMTAAGITLGYALLYASAVILRRDWQARIRHANIAMALALALVGVAALWLTPILNPQRIAANNQVARFAAGKTAVDQLDLWVLGNDLGTAGTAVIATLQAMPLDQAQAEALGARIARLHASGTRYAFEHGGTGPDTAALIRAIESALVLRPEDAVLPPDTFAGAFPSDLGEWAEGGARRTPQGNAGCVMVLADFVAAQPGDEAMLTWMTSQTRAELGLIRTGPNRAPEGSPIFLVGSAFDGITPETLDALHRGAFRLAPARVLSLSVGEVEVILQP